MSTPPSDVLLTGGTGTLGTELRRLLPGVVAPTREEMDVLDPGAIRRVLTTYKPRVVVHAAGFTDVQGAEEQRSKCWAVNVDGTRNVSFGAAAAGAFLIHISTDYVFDGRHGGYKEEDPLGAALNYYALTKIVSEAVARSAPEHLVIRSSFRPRAWPHQVAFTDVFTSQDYVDIVAPELASAILNCGELNVETLHIATERKSTYELARRRAPNVRPGLRSEAPVKLPYDISLDCSRWTRLRAELGLTVTKLEVPE